MNRCALFADVSNLYYCVNKKFENRKLDYERLLRSAEEIGSIQRAFAFGSQRGDEATPFIAMLRKIGYETKYKEPPSPMDGEKRSIRKAEWEVGIAVEVFRLIDRLDIVILCTSSTGFVPLVEWIKDQGVRVIIFSCGISRQLKEVAHDCIEIDESHLEDLKNNAA